MKKNTLVKKLSFSKLTIANLAENTMDNLRGGYKETAACNTNDECPYTFRCSIDYCESVRECPVTEWNECTIVVC